MKVDFPRISLALMAFTSLCLVVLFLVSLYSGYPAFILSALAAIGQQSNIDIALTFISKNEFQLLQVVLLFSVLLLCYVLFRHRVIFAGWAEFYRFIFFTLWFCSKKHSIIWRQIPARDSIHCFWVLCDHHARDIR